MSKTKIKVYELEIADASIMHTVTSDEVPQLEMEPYENTYEDLEDHYNKLEADELLVTRHRRNTRKMMQ